MFESVHIDDMIVVCRGPGVLANDVWQRFMSEFRKKPVARYIAACVGTPESTPVQREEIFALLHDNGIKVVTITDERYTRGVATAARWAGVENNTFTWEELPQAIERVGITDRAHAAYVANVITRLRQAVERAGASTSKRTA